MFWNLHYGSKGQVFSLDALIAIFIVTIILVSSFFLINKQSNENYELLQQVTLANDLFTTLDINGKLDTLNKNVISTHIESILPKNFVYGFKLECQNKIIQMNKSISSTLINGERVLVTDNLDLCIMRYGIWPK